MKAIFLRSCLLGVMAMFGAGAQAEVVNDVTLLNPIDVDRVLVPTSTEEMAAAIRGWKGPISIGGARHSQGGQIAEEHALFLDLRHFDRVLAFDARQRLITVQAGISWRKVQEAIDPYGLSVWIMQTYDNFTVGGSLSVNCHGRYVGAGPVIRSVQSIKVLLADGTTRIADPTHDAELFNGVIGGYGGLGVIVEATLRLVPNTKVRREAVLMPIEEYRAWFEAHVRGSPNAVFHNGDIYPPRFKMVRAVTFWTTDEPVTEPDRLLPVGRHYEGRQFLIGFVSSSAAGKWAREYILEPLLYLGHPVVWRNHEASHDVAELEPKSRASATYVLQEYFVPENRFDAFYPRMAGILTGHRANVLNVSIRHSIGDPGSLLAWAKGDVFAFVLYYRQGTSPEDRQAVGAWTRELIDAALDLGGSYYLPYQIWATPEEFRRAYPNAGAFFALKGRLDPDYRFRNKLWDAYYQRP